MGPSRRNIVASILAALMGAGCRCAPSPEPAPPALPHYGEWEALVRATSRGDRAAAEVYARDLTEGEAGLWEGEGGPDALARVSAALAFIPFADDDAERSEAVATAMGACGACHRAAGASPPAERPPWAHETAAQWASWGLLWGAGVAPPADGAPPLSALARAVSAPMPVDSGRREDPDVVRAGRILAGCAACHGAGPEE